MTTRKSKKPVVPDTRAGFTNPDEPLGLVETEMADLVKNGPFSVLYTSQKENTQVRLIRPAHPSPPLVADYAPETLVFSTSNFHSPRRP
mmetsp:Transcript_14164/g.28998  ORF Transcript_14164/g.28998 Transcript_14164/m.28998 type:complete len:89 (-) Transcript_14164:560-826(-)